MRSPSRRGPARLPAPTRAPTRQLDGNDGRGAAQPPEQQLSGRHLENGARGYSDGGATEVKDSDDDLPEAAALDGANKRKLHKPADDEARSAKRAPTLAGHRSEDGLSKRPAESRSAGKLQDPPGRDATRPPNDREERTWAIWLQAQQAQANSTALAVIALANMSSPPNESMLQMAMAILARSASGAAPFQGAALPQGFNAGSTPLPPFTPPLSQPVPLSYVGPPANFGASVSTGPLPGYNLPGTPLQSFWGPPLQTMVVGKDVAAAARAHSIMAAKDGKGDLANSGDPFVPVGLEEAATISQRLMHDEGGAASVNHLAGG
eukprot:SM000258S09102  [mRNA]  locus=s258:75669:77166:+ [translate_table: standard]